MIKKADIILGIFLILLCAASLFLLNLAGAAGDLVTITVDGREYGAYALAEDQRIEIEQATRNGKGSPAYNVVVIEDGQVFMEESNCGNQICVNQGRISRAPQTIVCLPNHVVVSISGAEGQMDAVAY